MFACLLDHDYDGKKIKEGKKRTKKDEYIASLHNPFSVWPSLVDVSLHFGYCGHLASKEPCNIFFAASVHQTAMFAAGVLSVLRRRTDDEMVQGHTAACILEQVKEKHVQNFLTKFNFSAINDLKAAGEIHCSACNAFPRTELLSPIHVAVVLGDDETVRMLLQKGADPEAQTSKGRTVMDMAQDVNVNGSSLHVLNLLRSAIKVVALAF